jgi:two-component system chemotaxis sensor kinase CheA
MERHKYLDLYVSESQEHLGYLNRALLAVEQDAGASAVEEAFRAAHTLKGMSATMGFSGVSQLAHDVETLLDQIRSGARAVDATLIDELLASADTLERGIAAAANGQPDTPKRRARKATVEPGVLNAEPLTPAETAARMRAGTRYATVVINANEQMKIARALIITRSLVKKALALRSEPQQFGEDFDGSFALVLAPDADESAVTVQLAAIPEVVSFALHTAGEQAVEKAKLSKPAEAGKTSFLRVDQRRMDDVAEGLGEIGVLQSSIERLANAQAGPLSDLVTRMSRLLTELQHTVLAMRMVPVGEVFDRFPRMVRDSSRALGKQVNFVIEGRDIEIDRAILEEMADPLMHLLRNALDHGIELPAERYAAGKPEKARLTLRAWRDRSSVRIQIAEDGRGVNVKKVLAKARRKGLTIPAKDELTQEDLLRILAHPGFSTAEQVTDVSGRGVGLDAVVTRIRSLGGAIDMQSKTGEGTTFTLRLPVTLAIAQALRVRIGEEDYAIPLTHVAEALELGSLKIDRSNGREMVQVREEVLPLIRLRSVLCTPTTGAETAAVVAELGDRRTALAVDRVIGREQILVKHFDSALGTLPLFSGVTLLPDGRPALVLDPISVV